MRCLLTVWGTAKESFLSLLTTSFGWKNCFGWFTCKCLVLLNHSLSCDPDLLGHHTRTRSFIPSLQESDKQARSLSLSLSLSTIKARTPFLSLTPSLATVCPDQLERGTIRRHLLSFLGTRHTLYRSTSTALITSFRHYRLPRTTIRERVATAILRWIQ